MKKKLLIIGAGLFAGLIAATGLGAPAAGAILVAATAGLIVNAKTKK